jgi:hypothetical protein
MSGVKMTFPVAVSDPTNKLPYVRDDKILTAGSLSLIDFNHSSAPLVGIPADTAVIQNIAWKEASAAAGAGTQAEWNHVLRRSTGLLDAPGTPGSHGFIERSTKGGLHAVISQVNSGNGQGLWIGRSGASVSRLQQYIYDHSDNDYYFSTWGYTTRLALANTVEDPHLHIFGQASATGNYLALFNRALNGGVGKTDFNSPAVPQAAVGPQFRSMSQTAWLNTKASSAANIVAAVAAIGYFLQGYTGFGANKARSAILYRSYVEDLTVSGRTHAQVKDIDFALYTRDVLTAGGKYYGDTFTDPATYP